MANRNALLDNGAAARGYRYDQSARHNEATSGTKLRTNHCNQWRGQQFVAVAGKQQWDEEMVSRRRTIPTTVLVNPSVV
ncbi:MAG: hypothetical protein GY904_07485 [Planctomycetaceae bacterium]|nr:hypothetical protein [Planctomycetaceae bacterium]